jgi:hypothetical protein
MVKTKMKNFSMADWINILESRRYGLVTRRKGRELTGCAAHPVLQRLAFLCKTYSPCGVPLWPIRLKRHVHI